MIMAGLQNNKQPVHKWISLVTRIVISYNCSVTQEKHYYLISVLNVNIELGINCLNSY
jgi:hypothetical protein